jgi:hypothetical protein
MNCSKPSASSPVTSRVRKWSRPVAPVSDWRAPVENRRYHSRMPNKVLGQRVAECEISGLESYSNLGLRYSAIRMEPAWTALGQAAGLAAAMSVKEGVEARALDVARLQRRLHELGAMTIYVPDLDPERRVPKPAWDPPGHFSARIPSWTERSRYFQAVQYFGTRGFFHDLAGSEGVRPAGTNLATGQWRIAITGHDAGLSRPIDPALAARWLGLAGANPRADLVADGRLTRGEFLHRLHSLQMAR